MNALSVTMANNCENAKNATCTCRCGGALHGAKRLTTDTQGNTARVEFEQLPETDPHFVPSKKRAKELAKERLKERKRQKREARWKAWEEMMAKRNQTERDLYALP